MFAGNIDTEKFNKLSNLMLSLTEQGFKSGYFEDQQECFELLVKLLEEDFKTGNPGEGEVFDQDL